MRQLPDEKQSKIYRLAIMGGTFDPIHYGHLVTAEAVRHRFNIDKVLFVPTGHPPHKHFTNISHTEHRYLMTVLATVTNPYFDVSRIEIDRKGITYTIDTIKELKKIYGEQTELFFITGADAVQEIFSWKNPDDLLRLCTFVAATRPEYHKEELLQSIDELRENFESLIHFIEVPSLSISSSDIRNRVNSDRPIKYLLPEAVENYIFKFGLYL